MHAVKLLKTKIIKKSTVKFNITGVLNNERKKLNVDIATNIYANKQLKYFFINRLKFFG